MTANSRVRPTLVVGAALALALAACSAETTEPTTSNVPQTTSIATTTAAVAAASPQELLDRFASSWLAGDWEGMAGIADTGVVTIAQEAGQANSAEVVWVTSCGLDSAGTGSCELLYTAVGDEGYAQIYSARYAAGSDGDVTIVDLVWAGDAG